MKIRYALIIAIAAAMTGYGCAPTTAAQSDAAVTGNPAEMVRGDAEAYK